MARRGHCAACIAVALIASGLFVFGHSAAAADFTGGPCVVGSSCTLSRAVNVHYPGKHSYDLAIGGVMVACVQSEANPFYPSYTFTLTADEAAVSSWSIQAYSDYGCTSGALLRDSGVNVWDTIEVISDPVIIRQMDFEATLPTFSWGYATDTGNGTATTTLEDHIGNAIGASTSTFPMCVGYGWLQLLDQLVGMTDGTVAPQTFTISQSLNGTSSTTLTLDMRNNIASSTALNAIMDKLAMYVLGAGWLAFGLYIFADVFLKKSGGEEV